MHEIQFSEQLDKKLSKLAKKNRNQLKIIDKKVHEIVKNPNRYKNLTGGEMKGLKRVHIDDHFVLIFDVDNNKKIVRFLDYDHHDKVY